MSAPISPAPSDLRALDAAMRHTQRLATLGTLTGMIAHEFNNLLTPVLCYAQMALDAPADLALTRKALQKAAAGSERAGQIAEAILDLTRECHLPGAASETCSVAAAVKGALACLAREPGKDGIAVAIDVREAGDAAMRPVSLQQMILNLVLNARKALLRNGDPDAGRGSGGAMELTVRGRRCAQPLQLPAGAVVCGAPNDGPVASCPDREPAWVEIVVQDTGCGIHADLLPHVFDAWVTERTPAAAAAQARASAEHAQPPDRGNDDGLVAKGTGLGLAMCAELVRAAGGWIWVASEVGEGTQVGLVLPGAP